MKEQIVTRRRGVVLEEALLEAAWIELSTHGYLDFTFEGVIQRAGTSRSVVYRRWPNRLSLAVAAIAYYVKANPISVPDLGNVRDELCLLLRKTADRGPPKLMRLLFEMNADMAAVGDGYTKEQFGDGLLGDVIRRGIARGEIDEARLTLRIINVPTGLLLIEIMLTARQISDEAITEIIDQVFLPLVKPQRT